jgi:hypothetical protein
MYNDDLKKYRKIVEELDQTQHTSHMQSLSSLKDKISNGIKQSGLKIDPCKTDNSNGKLIIAWWGRFFIVADINGLKMPFYLSSGLAGKKNVPSGKWYPFFGIGPDGWLNKGTEEQMLNHYGSQTLHSIADKLNSAIGDLRPYQDAFPHVPTLTVMQHVNQNMHPVRYGDDPGDNKKKVLAKIGDLW